MSLDDYLEQKRRNRVRRELRRTKPYLMGLELENEIDRLLGVAYSGKLDWKLLVEDSRAPSDYPTPESVGKKELSALARELNTTPYVLYWFFIEKVNKLRAAGRTKSDYYALLKDTAQKSLKKELSEEELVIALRRYAKDIMGREISFEEAHYLLLKDR